jgi:hypothetical protein
VDFGHNSEFGIPKNTKFQKRDLLPSSGEGRDTYTLLGPLEGVKILTSPEDGKRSNYQNFISSSSLEFLTIDNMDKCIIPVNMQYGMQNRTRVLKVLRRVTQHVTALDGAIHVFHTDADSFWTGER